MTPENRISVETALAAAFTADDGFARTGTGSSAPRTYSSWCLYVGGGFWWTALLGAFGATVAASVTGAKVELSLEPYGFRVSLFGLEFLLGAPFALGFSRQLGSRIPATCSEKPVAEAKPDTSEGSTG